MLTLNKLDNHTEFEFETHLDMEDPIPVLTGNQAQGDIYILAQGQATIEPYITKTPQNFTTVDIVEGGDNGRNPHTLLDLDGKCIWHAGASELSRAAVSGWGFSTHFDIGTLIVPEGESCWLVHPEHGANGIGGGTYVIRRQREHGEVVRAVAD